MSKDLVIVDVDDVLLDLNKSVARRLRSMGYTFCSEENFVTYDLNKSIDISMLPLNNRNLMSNGLGCPRELILSCYKDVESFKGASLTDNFYKGLKLLSENFNVLVHTNSFSLQIVKFKIDLFERLCSDLDLNFSFCVGDDKPHYEDVFAVFEDCVENLLKYSDDSLKILVDKPHNRELFNHDKLCEVKNLQRVENFYDGVQYLLRRC